MRGSGSWLQVASVVGALCLATVAVAQTTAEPVAAPKGERVLSSVEVTATVTKIDTTTREVALKTDAGLEYSFVVSDAVKNFPQLKVGDVVTATYTEALAYEVKKSSKPAGAATTDAATPGAKPADVRLQELTETVTVAAIDPKVPSITFRQTTGTTKTIKVLHPEKLEGVKVGDVVDITYTAALAIQLKEAAKK